MWKMAREAPRAIIVVLVLALPLGAQEAPRRTLTYDRLMQVRQVEGARISEDGRWIAFAAVPDRGDGEVVVRSTEGETRWIVARGARPEISADGRWVAMRLEPSFEARETSSGDDAPRPGLALLSTGTGQVTRYEEVRSFAFSGDGAWLAFLRHEPRGDDDEPDEEGQAPEGEEPEGEEPEPRTREDPGTEMVLVELETGAETPIQSVEGFSFGPEGRWLAWAVATEDGRGDGLFLRDLREGDPAATALESGAFLTFESLTWNEDGTRLAWLSAQEDREGEPGHAALRSWSPDGEVRTLVAADGAPEGWHLPAGSNRLTFSEDGRRLFFGIRPGERVTPTLTGVRVLSEPEEDEEADADTTFDPYDLDAIVADREVDVWHTDDPLIRPNQKQSWSEWQRQTWRAVYHLDRDRMVQLGDTLVEVQSSPDNPRTVLGGTSAPYLKERTWAGFKQDLYVIGLDDGVRRLVAEELEGGGATTASWIGMYHPSWALSPEGRYAAYYRDRAWHLYDVEEGSTTNLTEGMDVAFHDVDHDYPSPPPGYGIGGWTEGDGAVLIHDKYDLWQLPTDGGDPVNLTAGRGRSEGRIYRVMEVDPELDAYGEGDRIYLRSFHEADKSFGFHAVRADRPGVEPLLEGDARFDLVAKAREADRLLYTRQRYDEFPDLWVAGPDFDDGRRLTDVNPGLLEEFAWGRARLVRWRSDDGIPLDGVAILPGNYEEGRRYPVMTYFYRFFSQRLHEFNEPVVNHRPSFPIYASDGYIVFLPDVRFEVGRPGLAAAKSVVPGVKKLVEMGLADPDALGLHGHSWSGYTTAFIVTQTDVFAAAVAGAPVSNMTSAYGGIRWESGLARQFQYETSQSRLSGSLWEARADYVENSPLFYADRVSTPLLIQHGDEDGAVPWYQSIELYLALRRLGKDAVFLQYRGEPHHLRKYPNKLDYSLKMKAFFDHFLKGAPAPDWWTDGVPYTGN